MAKEHEQAKVFAVIYNEDMDSPLLLLRLMEQNRVISLPVTAFEASNLIVASEGMQSASPLLHDVMITVLENHKYTIEYIEIYGTPLAGFYGRIYYRRAIFHSILEVNPVDALIIGLRRGLPIFIDRNSVETTQKVEDISRSYSTEHGHVLFLEPQSIRSSPGYLLYESWQE
ncbi:MAG: bifunctional nuclease domain-containing protein [Termitinemataceae bacterium]